MISKLRVVMRFTLETIALAALGCLCVSLFRASVSFYNPWQIDSIMARESLRRFADEIESSGMTLDTNWTFQAFGECVSNRLPACPFYLDQENPFPTVLYPGGRYCFFPGAIAEIRQGTPLLWFEGDAAFRQAIRAGKCTRLPALTLAEDVDSGQIVIYISMLDARAIPQLLFRKGH